MQQALKELLGQVESIQRTVDLRENLVAFGSSSPQNLSSQGENLHRVVRQIGQSGLQPSLNGSVLLLAAALEQFTSNTIIEYAANLPKVIPNYEDLPKSVRSANEELTGQALSTHRTWFADYDRRRFVENLTRCNAGDVPYVLNGEALALQGRNLRAGNLRDLFSRLGISDVWNLAGCTKVLKDWSGSQSTESTNSLAKNKLNELIDVRNQLAHGFGSSNPGPNDVNSYLQFIQALSKSLVEGLTTHSSGL